MNSLQPHTRVRRGFTVKDGWATNQGLYNGFLAERLFWGLYLGSAGNHIKVFFLLCVLVAGIYGAATASKRRPLDIVEAVPAIGGAAATVFLASS